MNYLLYRNRGNVRPEDLAVFHPAILAWFKRKAVTDYRRWLGLATLYVALYYMLERSTTDIHEQLCLAISRANRMLPKADAVAAPSVKDFHHLLQDFNSDEAVRSMLSADTLLMSELGEVGELRRSLWDGGIREPLLSALVQASFLEGVRE